MKDKFVRLGVNTFNHLNFCVARAWLHGCVLTQLGDAILNFRRRNVLRMGRWKNN